MEINPDHITAVKDFVNDAPFFRLLSMELRDMGPGYSVVEIKVQNKHLNPYGGVQGGVYTSIIDTAGYWAVYCGVPEHAGLVSLDTRTDILAIIREGTIIATGKQVKAGKTICLSEVTVENEAGRLLAHGTAKLLVTEGLQNIGQMITSVRGPIPAKFREVLE